MKNDSNMGVIYQMTGLSGAGKTTLSKRLKQILKEKGYRVAIVDGDIYRQTLCSDLGFSRADRITNIKRLGRFAFALAADFDLVLIAAINPYEEGRDFLRRQFGAPLLFLDCSLQTLIHRDPKGLYKSALRDEDDPKYIAQFTGISDPFERPLVADLYLDTDALSEEQCIQQLTAYITNHFINNKIDPAFIDFLSRFRKESLASPDQKSNDIAFMKNCRIFSALFELDIRDLYRFLFLDCKDDVQFEKWLSDHVGDAELYSDRIEKFLSWISKEEVVSEPYTYQYLTQEQLKFWEEQGYLVLPGLIPAADCDAVQNLICKELGINLGDVSTWCPTDPRWQGIMLFSVKDESMEVIRNNQTVRSVFEDLYRSKGLLSLNAPLGYMPPLWTGYPFRSSPLHWDIDPETGPRNHIQGIIYLDDVAEDGGAFSLIPAMHKQYKELIANYATVEATLEVLRSQNQVKLLSGKKGDLILWLDATPHAATPNQGSLPRFVQYLSFECI